MEHDVATSRYLLPGDKYTGLDRFGRVVKQYWVGGGGTVNTATLVDGFAYTYDADGNVTSETNGMDSAFNENFTYDGLSRLTTVSQGTNSGYESMTLDALGNMSSQSIGGTTTTRTVNAAPARRMPS